MRDDSLRQTGRTTKMLEKSLEVINCFEKVYLVFHSLRMSEYARNMFLEILPRDRIPVKITNTSVIFKNTTYEFCNTVSIMRPHHNQDYAVFFDHVVKGEY